MGSAILFFYLSVEFAIVNWLVTYFKDTGVLSGSTAQLMTSLLWVVMFIGRMLGAVLVGRISRKTILLADGIGLTIFSLMVFLSRSEALIFIGIMGIGLFMATVYTCAMTLGTSDCKGNDVGVSSMILIGTTGGIITSAVVGIVAENAGIRMGMSVVILVTVLLLISILISVFDRSDQKKDKTQNI